MAPDERLYCGDLWCDGDHVSTGQRCYKFDTDPDNPDREAEDDPDEEPDDGPLPEVPC